MNEIAVQCPVCICPCRREVDIMLLQGWTPDEVCEMLPESPRRPVEIKAHLYAGHMNIDAQALMIVTVQLAQDIREQDSRMKEWAIRASQNNHTSAGKNGSVAAYFRESINFRLRYMEFLAKLAGLVGGRKDQTAQEITENHLHIAVAGDPGITQRVMKAQLERAGFVVERRKPKKPEPTEDDTCLN